MNKLAIQQRELAALAQQQRLRLAGQWVALAGPLRVVDGAFTGFAWARRHPGWTLMALLILVRAWAPARRLGAMSIVRILFQRWMGG